MSIPAFRDALRELHQKFAIWRPENRLKVANGVRSKWSNIPKQERTLATWDGKEYAPSKNTRTYHAEDPEADEKQGFVFERSSLLTWLDQEHNPDDYDPEVSLCEDCEEPIWFDVTTSGTVTTTCPRCGWSDAGKIYEASRRTVRGAFGSPSPLKARRRFWNVPLTISTAGGRRHIVNRRAPDRAFILAELAPHVLQNVPIHPSYRKGRSKYEDIIEFARRGDPFIVPVPPTESPAAFRNRIAGILTSNKRTLMGRWSVCRIKEGLRVGLIGSWRDVPGVPGPHTPIWNDLHLQTPPRPPTVQEDVSDLRTRIGDIAARAFHEASSKNK